MNVGGGGEKELRKLHHPRLDEKAVPKEKIVVEVRDVLEEDELQRHGIDEDVKDARLGADQVDAASQTPQQQPQDDSVCWERFLHLRSIKVLLVENDDSTRHIVTALLRNCSYEVIEAANALQAWKILEDLTNHIDLVLTEVVMPISGISLLCKIMSHRTRCNLPVIMMSSNDPMSLVFKCLSKGAVDFLVKPIRKNELKNLWQHVWRRCHSSSGSGSGSGSGSESGSGSGSQAQKSVKSKSVEKCGNNSCSNDGDDNESIGLNVGGGSDNGSGTQSSWTKQATEVDSPREKSPQNQLDECPDSTCALVAHSNAETSGTKLVPVTKTRKWHENKEELVVPEENAPKIKQLAMPKNQDIQLKPSSKLKSKHAALTGVLAITGQSLMDGTEVEAPNRSFDISRFHSKATNNTEPQRALHPISKGLAATKDLGAAVQDDRNVLKHSELSAFSRYRAVSNAYNSPTGNIGSSSSRGLSLNNSMKQSLHEIQSHSSVNPPNQCSNEVSNKIDRGSTTNNAFAKCVVMNKPAMTFSAKHLHPSSAFHPVEEDYSCSPHQGMLENVNEVAATKILAQPRGTHKELQNELVLHHYNHHHHHHIVCNSEQHLPLDHDDLSSKKMAVAAPHCGLSNVLSVPFKSYALYNVNRSASNDGQSRNKLAVNAGGLNIESDEGISGRSVNASRSESGSGNRVDNKMFTRREAALTKFRQKRKEKYLRKKVQHQCKKRKAEQRPLSREKFVGPTVEENTNGPSNI